MTDERHFQRYFEELQHFGTPEEVGEIRRKLGTPPAVLERMAKLDALLKRDEARANIWRFLGRTGAACLVILTVLGALKALLPAGWPW
jgi:hypothetical protein